MLEERGVGHGAETCGVGFLVSVELGDQARELPFGRHALVFARAVVSRVLERPGREAANAHDAAVGVLVKQPQHSQQAPFVGPDRLRGIVHGHLVAPRRQVEEKCASGDEEIMVGERVHRRPGAARVLQPIRVQVVGGNTGSAPPGLQVALQRPAIRVHLGTATRGFIGIGDSAFAGELGRAVRVHQPQLDRQFHLVDQPVEDGARAGIESHRQQGASQPAVVEATSDVAGTAGS